MRISPDDMGLISNEALSGKTSQQTLCLDQKKIKSIKQLKTLGLVTLKDIKSSLRSMVKIKNQNTNGNVREIMYKITGIACCFQVKHINSTWYPCQLEVLKGLLLCSMGH